MVRTNERVKVADDAVSEVMFASDAGTVVIDAVTVLATWKLKSPMLPLLLSINSIDVPVKPEKSTTSSARSPGLNSNDDSVTGSGSRPLSLATS